MTDTGLTAIAEIVDSGYLPESVSFFGKSQCRSRLSTLAQCSVPALKPLNQFFETVARRDRKREVESNFNRAILLFSRRPILWKNPREFDGTLLNDGFANRLTQIGIERFSERDRQNIVATWRHTKPLRQRENVQPPPRGRAKSSIGRKGHPHHDEPGY